MAYIKHMMLGILSCMAQELCAQDNHPENGQKNKQEMGLSQSQTVSDDMPRLGESLKSPFYKATIRKASDEFPLYMVRYQKDAMPYGQGDVHLLVMDSNCDGELTLPDDDVVGADYHVHNGIDKTKELGTTFKDDVVAIATKLSLNPWGEIEDRRTEIFEEITPVVNRATELLDLGQGRFIRPMERSGFEGYRP